MKKTISFICLVVCTLIWGTTFIAQDTGMDNIGPFTFNSVRFFVGFLAVAPFVFLFEKKKINNQIKNKTKEFSKLILPVGIFLFLGCIFQQVALLHTDVKDSLHKIFRLFFNSLSWLGIAKKPSLHPPAPHHLLKPVLIIVPSG